MFKKILVAVGIIIACFKIGEAKGFIGGVQKSFDKLKDECNLDDLTVKFPMGKNTTMTVVNKNKEVKTNE